jgi:hypothetical protein
MPLRRLTGRIGFGLGMAFMLVCFANTASADLITLANTATGFNSPIGVDYHAPTNGLVLSANYPTGNPNALDLVAPNGMQSMFSSLSNVGDEIYLASPRTTANGFIAGQVYTGDGIAGQIVRISPDGSVVNQPWVTLPGETGLLRGGLHIDTTGVWGGDLIVATTAGNVWRVNAAGVATKVGSVGSAQTLEGVVTVPNDPATYGPWAGKILFGNDSTALYTLDTAGNLTTYLLGFSATENLNIPNAGETFYGVDFAEGILKNANAGQWTPYVGDVILGEENGRLWDIKWNGLGFNETLLSAAVPQWEGATFAPTTLPGVVPEPSALVLLGTALSGLLASRVRHALRRR